jgi:hypothetical protein
MKRECVGGKCERLCDVAGGGTLGARLHEQPEYREPIFLRESSESGHSLYLFHNSTIIEMPAIVNEHFNSA